MTASHDTIERQLQRAAEGMVGPDDVAAAAADFVTRAEGADLVDVAWSTVDAPFGSLFVAATVDGLVMISFDPADDMLTSLSAHLSPRVLEAPARLDPVRRQLDEYFDGVRQRFELPIDWSLSRGFRREVLQRLFAEVGFGEVISYQGLAQRVGKPKASRAVGTSMATNPVPIVVPCHRVLRTGGALGGYGGGLDVKRFLLRHEGALLA